MSNSKKCVVAYQCLETLSNLLQQSSNSLSTVKRIHSHILKNAETQQNLFLQNKLIWLYAKTSTPWESLKVFDRIRYPDSVSWNSMIRAYTMHDQLIEALHIFHRMQKHQIKPDHFTFEGVLKSCSGLSLLNLGKSSHTIIVKQGFCGDLRLNNAIMNMYAKCNVLENARQVFDEMPALDISSYNNMISGCFLDGRNHEAMGFFYQMWVSRIRPNNITIALLLPVCIQLQAVDLARQIHGYCVKASLVSNIFVANALVNVYAKLRKTDDALRMFDITERKDSVTMSSLIVTFKNNGDYENAVAVFRDMLMKHLKPTDVTILVILSACAHLECLSYGMELHSYVVSNGLWSDLSVANSLMHMYSKCGLVDTARILLDKSEQKDAISYNSIISGFAENGQYHDAIDCFHSMNRNEVLADSVTVLSVLPALKDLMQVKEIHSFMVRNSLQNVSACNAFITHYAGLGKIQDAQKMFCSIESKDIVTWNSMLSGYMQNSLSREAIWLFRNMQLACMVFDTMTLSIVITACGELGCLNLGKEIHAYAIRRDRYMCDPHAIIDMYAKCDRISDAQKEYERASNKNVISDNIMIAAYWRCGKKEAALNLFNNMGCKDISTWNTVMSLYSTIEHGENEVFSLFRALQLTDEAPENVSIGSVLHACARMATLQYCREIHSYMITRTLYSDNFMRSSILDTYAKCGNLDVAAQIFQKTNNKDLVTWNTMISAYGIHGKGENALEVFHQMKEAGVRPDHISFISLLSACSHAGLVEKGLECFNHMTGDCAISPTAQHYACVVDLLGRAGRLDEAYQLINNMPMNPTSYVWGALFSACKPHGNVALAEIAAEKLFKMDPGNIGDYTLLSNIYAANGIWDGVEKVRRLIKRKGLYKTPGCSWIEVENNVQEFFVESGTTSFQTC